MILPQVLTSSAIKLGVAGAVLAASFTAGYSVAANRADKARLAAVAAQRDAQIAAGLAADVLRADMARADLEIRNALHTRALADRAAAAVARGDADGMRKQLAAIRHNATGGAPADGCGAERAIIDSLAGLLDEGAGLVDEGAERADEAARALDALRARDGI